ncbi:MULTISPECIES: hypothetical protein [unclassified Bradyrhizobium]|uniref:hypothetical protein n=1 Tax=unclassified Bradyrhizobium TaxID=2631580 RepID=UPI002478B897|nr:MULTISPECIES: hypothetical protein [unclassified Bradyrhizobium]WGS23650.1 hypothetical protein MTX22_19735 [Bradyrhizobium sp. ISRA463]WGS30676.1 hypothetical protein MTX19_17440 [Bradyrhizobium sp. ISRA464]
MSIDTAINRAFICPSRAGECDVEAVAPFEIDNGACTKRVPKHLGGYRFAGSIDVNRCLG